jgi:hypothetical protein
MVALRIYLPVDRTRKLPKMLTDVTSHIASFIHHCGAP